MADNRSQAVPRKYSLAQILNHIPVPGTEASDPIAQYAAAAVKRAADDEIASRGWRATSKKSQDPQDRHLDFYRSFIRFKEGGAHLSDENADAIGFRNDPKELAQLLRQFIIFVYHNAEPSRQGATHIDYGTLEDYRTSLMFWVSRKYEDAIWDLSSLQELKRKITEAMRQLYQTRTPGSPTRKRKRMPTIEQPELRQPMDFDVMNGMDPNNSEQHHLARNMSRQAELRAASLSFEKNELLHGSQKADDGWSGEALAPVSSLMATKRANKQKQILEALDIHPVPAPPIMPSPISGVPGHMGGVLDRPDYAAQVPFHIRGDEIASDDLDSVLMQEWKHLAPHVEAGLVWTGDVAREKRPLGFIADHQRHLIVRGTLANDA